MEFQGGVASKVLLIKKACMCLSNDFSLHVKNNIVLIDDYRTQLSGSTENFR